VSNDETDRGVSGRTVVAGSGASGLIWCSTSVESGFMDSIKSLHNSGESNALFNAVSNSLLLLLKMFSLINCAISRASGTAKWAFNSSGSNFSQTVLSVGLHILVACVAFGCGECHIGLVGIVSFCFSA